ncbi:MAG: (2Fe-2S)-binding protein [Pleurocapsa minor GSE-CHR-MK-17-07R]|jgi:ferredoxin|nr:(2Fe-2S)-binding protein [Pleurocapsa minor GSE-CHR-MK 17-07R]
MPILSFKDGKDIEVPSGKRLVLAIQDAGIDILHRCGGHAKCTTCRVTVLRGEPARMTQAEYERLEARGLLGEFRLSCQMLCEQDMTLVVANTVANSDVEDSGPRPAPEITPTPVWIDAPTKAAPSADG